MAAPARRRSRGAAAGAAHTPTSPSSSAINSRDLTVGEFIVHVDHGIGQFVGLRQITVGEDVKECVELRYRGKTLLVPIERLDLLQKYDAGLF